MGIETALLVGGGLVGSYIKSQGQKKAAAAQAKAIKEASAQSAATQQQMFQQGQEATQGYRQRGDWAGQEFQRLMTPEGQAGFAEQYTSGPMFEMNRKLAEEAALRGASATGGLRTGQTNVALSAIAPRLINQAYASKLQGLNTLQGYGSGASSQTAGLSTGVGTNVGATQYQGGLAATQPQFAADTAMSNFAGDAVSTLGGVGYDAFSAPKLQPTQVYSRPGQTYGR